MYDQRESHEVIHVYRSTDLEEDSDRRQSDQAYKSHDRSLEILKRQNYKPSMDDPYEKSDNGLLS